MSTTIDQRVVEMRFDNSHFEKNVSNTMSTLDKLKAKLNLSGASKGLTDINTAARGFSTTGLGSAVDTVSARFSALQVIGVTALANITNSAVNAGKSIVKSLTIDPIKSGFSEYETKMGSIQTILANTQHEGTNLDQVTAALEELNLYADKTIYNFQEMTRNIGTFTAAGVSLDTSVKSIQGIANLAAISGSTSQQASTAMYQLSQALSAGTVKLMDWNSVVNAGMGGKVFQDALMETSRMMKKTVKGYTYDVDALIKKNGSFRESLSEGWITADVLTQTLQQFTMAAEEGSAEWEKYKKSLMDTGYSEAQAESILKMANTATDAATKVKTFTQLMDTLKESAQSGWAQTWELIVGDFEEAKSFFTELSDLFGGIIGKSADRRNSLISDTMTSNWDKLIGKINEAGIETEQFEKSIRKVVGEDKLESLISDYGSLEEAARKGKISSDDLKEAIDGISSAADKFDVDKLTRKLWWGHEGEDVKQLQTLLNALGHDVGKTGVDGIIGSSTTKAIREFQKARGIGVDGVVGKKTLAELKKAAEELEAINVELDEQDEKTKENIKSWKELADAISKPSGRELLLDSLMNVIKAIHRPLAAIGEAFRNVFSVTPDQLYSALEGINKFTSKFVMKGLLDNTTWTNLTDAIQQAGVETSVFEEKLKKVLKDDGIDVDKLIEKYGSLGEAFNKGAISLDHIKEALIELGFSDAFINGGENADKLRRAFEGLFAVVEVFGRFVGGGFKFAFDVLSAVLETFDMDILDLVANMGDALVAFRDWVVEGNLIAQMFDKLLEYLPVIVENLKQWFAAFKETPAIAKLVDAINAIREAFEKFANGEIDVSELANQLGTNLANALKSLPEIAIQIGQDFIAGFVKGIGSSVTGVINDIVTFCIEFVTAFATALGVESPSWKAFEIASDFFQGFINGAKEAISGVISVLKKIGEKIVDIFKDLWDSITDESGNIQWGKIIAGGIIFSVLWILKQFAEAFGGIAGAFGSLDEIFDNTADAIKSFKKVVDGYAWDMKAKAVQKMAIAVAILAASVVLIAQIDDVGKLWNAVGVIFVLSAIVAALAFAMSKLSDASLSYSKEGGLNIKGIMSGLLQIGIVVGLLALVVKLIGTMNWQDALQGFIGLAAIAGGLLLFMKSLGKITTTSGDIAKIGSVMIQLSFAMILLISVCKLVDGLSAEEVGGGILFAAAFALFIKTLTWATKGIDKDVSKIGGMMVKLAIAMGLMIAVVNLADTMSTEEMLKGAAFAAGFALFVKILVSCTKIGKEQQIAKLSGLILSISFSLTLMVGVCKLVGTLSVGEMLKGAAFVAGFAVFLKTLVGILKIGNDQQMAKVTGTILALSIAIGLLAGVSVLLGLVDIASLTKGVVAVGILSLFMANMAKALNGANDAKGAIMMMAIAIGVMAASIVALSFVKPEDLASATAALATLMGMFALMVKASAGAKVAIGSTVIMLGVVLALAGILAVLAGLEVGSTLEVAASIGLLMVTMGATMQLISRAGAGASKAMIPMLALTGILALVGGILGVMAYFNIEPSIETATSLSILLMSLAGVTAILTLVGAGAPAALGGIAAFAIVVAGVGAIMLALAGLNALFPDLQNWLDTGIDILEKIGVGIGKFVGGLIGGIGEGMMDSLLNMVDTFGVIVDKLVEISANGANINVDGFDGVEKLLGVLGSIGLTTVGTSLSDIFTLGGTSMEKFQTDGVAFFTAMKEISAASKGITFDEAAMDYVIDVAEDLAKIQSSLDPIGGVISWFTGRNDLAAFGTNIGEFISSMKIALSSLEGTIVNKAALDPIISAAQELATLQASLEPIGGMITWFTGRDDLGKFGENVGLFISSMKTALSSLNGTVINTAALDPIISASKSLAELQTSLEPIGGVISWFSGRDDLGTFGTNVGLFISSMKIALGNLEGATLDEAALNSVITTATRLSELQSKLEPMGGVITWFSGRTDLGTFGINIGLFGDAMGKLKTAMGEDGISEAVITSVTNAGNAIIALDKALPEEGWFDGKMNLSEFSGYIASFASAMGHFATEVGEADFTAIDASIVAANKIKTLIGTLVDLDASGVASFAGVGFGDGHLVNIGQAIGKYGEEVADLNISAVDTSVSAATRLKTLIGGLANLDTSGIENFKIGTIGDAMKTYSNNVGNIDTNVIDTSVTAALKLRSLIAGLVGLDTSGITNFKVESIGSAIKRYANSVSGVNLLGITTSISAANKLKTFIGSLSGLNTSGISTFKKAISDLSTVDLNGLVSSFSGKAGEMSSAAKQFINAMITGIEGGSSGARSAMKNVVDGTLQIANDNVKNFGTAGKQFVTKLSDGIKSMRSSATSAARSVASSASSAAEDGYSGMYSAGVYLGEGLVAGIDAMWSDAYWAGYSLGQAAVQGEKDGQASNSPSKATIKAGKWLGEGLVIGIKRMGNSVYKAGSAMGENAVDSISGNISRISDIISGDIDAQPTIRPVLDLSDIRSGVGAIGNMLDFGPSVGVMANINGISTMMNRRSQNGANSEVVSAIDKLRKDLDKVRGNSYSIGDISYDDGSSVGNAVLELVRAMRVEGRI